MKNLSICLCLFLFSYTLSAQEAAQIIKTSLNDVRIAMYLADFQSLHPKAEGDITMPGDAGIQLSETVGKAGIKSIEYFFKTYANSPLYRIEIQFEDNNRKDKATKTLFGNANHPNKNPDYWLLYKGESDYPTVAFAMNEVLTILAAVDPSLLQDDLFNTLDAAKAVDLRIYKNRLKVPIRYNNIDYGNAMTEISALGNIIGTPMSQIDSLCPNAVKQPVIFDFRTEYLLPVNRNGLKAVTFIYDNDGTKPLYETIFEFESADTLRQLAPTLDSPTSPEHPTVPNAWVIGIGENKVVYLLWIYENKVIVGASLPNTEHADNAWFKLPDLFIERFLAAQKAANEQGYKK